MGLHTFIGHYLYPSVFEHTGINILIYKDLHVKNSLESAS